MSVSNIKKIPNISHVPQSEEILKKVLQFLKTPKEELIFYDFLRSSGIIKTRQPINETENYKDSTERKWKNHLKNLHIILETKENNKNLIKLSEISLDYVNQKVDLSSYIHTTVQTSPKFNSVLLDIIELSYLISEFDSLTSLYSYLREEFHYVNRSVSATRNLTGIMNYMSIGKILKKEKNKIELLEPIFFTAKSLQPLLLKTKEYVAANLKYGGYASIKELLAYLKISFPKYTNQQINFILRRIIRDSDEFLYQAASSNKERGIIHARKNILFIRLK